MGSSLRRSRRVLRAALDLRELVLELGDPIADPAAIELERGLAGALAADAAAHAVAAAAALAQPRARGSLQPRDLDLQPGLAGAGVAMEDLEDHAGAIEDVGAGRLLEVALLGRRQVVIDEHDLRAGLRGRRAGGRGRFAIATARCRALAASAALHVVVAGVSKVLFALLPARRTTGGRRIVAAPGTSAVRLAGPAAGIAGVAPLVRAGLVLALAAGTGGVAPLVRAGLVRALALAAGTGGVAPLVRAGLGVAALVGTGGLGVVSALGGALGSILGGLVARGLAAAGLLVAGHDAGAAGPRRELDELALAEHEARGEPGAALGDPADRIEAERPGQALQLGDRRGELGVADVGELHGDDDRGRPLRGCRDLLEHVWPGTLAQLSPRRKPAARAATIEPRRGEDQRPRASGATAPAHARRAARRRTRRAALGAGRTRRCGPCGRRRRRFQTS